MINMSSYKMELLTNSLLCKSKETQKTVFSAAQAGVQYDLSDKYLLA